MIRATPIVLAGALLLAAGAARAAGGGVVEEARLRLEAGEPREAIRLLRTVSPRPTEATLLLARAYLDDGNDFWALRTLLERPDDPAAALWATFVQLKQGALDDAEALLAATAVPEDTALAARRALLAALLDSAREEPERAQEALGRAAAAREMYPEDAEALRRLRAALDPAYRPALSGRLELVTGATSNGLAGSPIDPAKQDDGVPSGLGQLGASLRYAPAFDAPVRPGVELDLRGLGLAEEEARDLSYVQLSARPGFSRGSWFAGYRFEILGVLGKDRYADGAHVFSHAHRGEAEVMFPGAGMTAFAGAGRRVFRELARERTEADGGMGLGFRPLAGIDAVAALTLRWHDARDPKWNLRGGSALLSADVTLSSSLSLRAGLVLSRDEYPDSRDGFVAGAQAREDTLLRPSATAWLGARDGLRVGLGYEPSRRWSTVDGYGYTDHRVLVRALWVFSADPGDPATTAPEGHVPLAWGLEAGEDLQERISELLRQDEAIRRGSSCLE
jgi:hypothetical protein